MFLPVNCLFIAAVMVLLAVIIIYTSVRSFKTRGEFPLSDFSRSSPVFSTVQRKRSHVETRECCDEGWHFAD